MPFFSYLNDNSDITDIFFADPKRFSGIHAFTDNVLRSPSPLSIAERELIAAFVSGLNECSYCYGVHASVARNFGIEPEQIELLVQDIDKADISDKLKPVMRYVKKLTQTPSRMTEQDAQDVYAVGWSEKALYDVICICSIFNFFNRLLDGHGIKGYEGLFDYGADHLSKRGYKMPRLLMPLIKWQINKSKKAILKKKT